MKVFHRIGCHLMLLVLLHCSTAGKAPSLAFTKCADSKKNLCLAHAKTCSSYADYYQDEYRRLDSKQIKEGCTRYLILGVKDKNTVEVEFGDETIKKESGATFFGRGKLFECKDNKVSSPSTEASFYSINDNQVSYDTLYCHFTISVKNPDSQTISDFLTVNRLNKVGGLDIFGFDVFELVFPCDWNGRLFTKSDEFVKEYEDQSQLKFDGPNRICEPPYINWYLPHNEQEGDRNKGWTKINKFICTRGKISTTKTADDSVLEFDLEDLANGATKCTRPKCSVCECKFCDKTDSNYTEYIKTDGHTCATLKCPNMIEVTLKNGDPFAYSQDSIECADDGMWQVYSKPAEIVNATCIDEVLCTKYAPIVSGCPSAEQLHDRKHYECRNATIKNDGSFLCIEYEEVTFYKPEKGDGYNITHLNCNTRTGHWDSGNGQTIKGGTVYCLKEIKSDQPAPEGAQMKAGTIISIIGGVAILLVIGIVFGTLFIRYRIRKRANRHEMPSVSITGKKSKKKKRKMKDPKGGKTTSNTSEVSAPAPPPCPDSLNFVVEPEPQQSGGPPSSGGDKPSLVGPDTGKPDRPAELIDIKLEKSEKSATDNQKKSMATEINTITGTSFDKSNVGSVAKDTTKTEKNGESARSDTGRNETKKKRKFKDGKLVLDRNGKGLTDDDDYNIDEGAKPVSHVDKHKKPYMPAVDPRKKMINVTMTEDEDGRVKPRGGKSRML